MATKTEKADQADDPATGSDHPGSVEVKAKRAVRNNRFKGLRLVILAAVAFGLLLSIGAYAFTPAALRKPAYQHYHFRLQIMADGKAVDFADATYQEGYSKDNCNANLTTHPFHFHDNRDQLAHVHWDGMTGGLFLKYYGWNFIGGPGNILGYRFDQLPKVSSVPIHGKALPSLNAGDRLYIYSGDRDHFQLRSSDDFLHQDLEVFFNKKSNLEKESTSFWEGLFPKAYAHGSAAEHAAESVPSQADLESVNNLLGNVVIFAQKERPSDKAVKDRFDHLIPLEPSTCGG